MCCWSLSLLLLLLLLLLISACGLAREATTLSIYPRSDGSLPLVVETSQLICLLLHELDILLRAQPWQRW